MEQALSAKSPQKWLLYVACFLCCFLCSAFTAHYLNIQPTLLFFVALLALSILSIRYLKGTSNLSRSVLITWAVFSLALALSLVLGFHIIISGETYTGLSDENYIAPYGAVDVIAVPLIAANLFPLFFALHSFISKRQIDSAKIAIHDTIPLKRTLLCSLALFLMFLPYLLIYFPGFIFGDTLLSFHQIFNGAYNNHHPYFYTTLIRACLKVTSMCGFGLSAGCTLYCLIQMSVMACCFSYLANWIATRCKLKIAWLVVLIAVLGLCPYIATYSIAMWKDPLFSCAVIVATLMIADYALTSGKCASAKCWAVILTIVLVLMGLLRSNGVMIIALLVVVFAGIVTFPKAKKEFIHKKKVLASAAASLVACLLITGPLYNALGVVKAPRAEALGIPIVQMARVVVQNGNMTESDAAYMNSILPISRYAEVYTPACVDTLKWADGFNNEALDDPSFFQHWLNMFLSNPGTYFEAWELQTFGFWAINSAPANTYKTNISGGIPRNTSEENSWQLDELGIKYGNLLGADWLRQIFPQDSWSIPLSFIHWFLIWLILTICLLKKPKLCLPLLPSIGLAASLLLASPIWYWPRYGAAEQFLLPFYVSLLFLSLAQEAPLSPEQNQIQR